MSVWKTKQDLLVSPLGLEACREALDAGVGGAFTPFGSQPFAGSLKTDTLKLSRRRSFSNIAVSRLVKVRMESQGEGTLLTCRSGPSQLYINILSIVAFTAIVLLRDPGQTVRNGVWSALLLIAVMGAFGGVLIVIGLWWGRTDHTDAVIEVARLTQARRVPSAHPEHAELA